jgi:hypothetical protein
MSISKDQLAELVKAYVTVLDARNAYDQSSVVGACMTPLTLSGDEVNDWRDENSRPAKTDLATVTEVFNRLLKKARMTEEQLITHLRQIAQASKNS